MSEYNYTYRFRLYPNREQRRTLARTFGCARYVHNWGKEVRTNAYHGEGESLSYTDTAKRLRKEQQKLSRKEKGSNSWKRQKKRVAKAHAKVADQRKDWLEKLTTKLVREYDLIVCETLAVENMQKNGSRPSAMWVGTNLCANSNTRRSGMGRRS